jgi:hypothetical protein
MKAMMVETKGNRIWKWFCTCVVFTSLMFTVTNAVPVSLGYALLLPALPFLLYRAYKQKRLASLHVWLLITYAYFAFCTLRFDAGSLLRYGFYRHDGSFFPLFVPILLCSLMEWKVKPVLMAQVFTLFASLLNVALYLWYLISPETCVNVAGERLFFYSLFTSHSAAGGFLLCLCCYALGFLMTAVEMKKRLLWLLLFAGDIVCLVAVYSRGSILGAVAIVIAALWLYFKDKGLYKKSRILAKLDIYVFLAVLIVFMLGIGVVCNALAPMDEYEICTLNADGYATFPTGMQNSALGQKMGWLLNDGLFRGDTIIDRAFYLWPRAMDLFLKSPVFGMGTGSYDDVQIVGRISKGIVTGRYTFAGNNLLDKRILNDNVTYSPAHAHNSYLHVMAENGIIGLLLILILCFYMRKAILALPNQTLRLSLYYCLIGVLVASFFENRLFAPAQMLPFALLLGIAMGEKAENA